MGMCASHVLRAARRHWPRCPIPLGIVSRASAGLELEDVVRCSRSAAPAMRTCKTQSAQTASGFDTGTVCAGGVGMKIHGTNTTVFFVWACIVKSEPKSVVLCLLQTLPVHGITGLSCPPPQPAG